MSRRLFTAIAVASFTASLSAQSFNLDFGEPTATPSSGYAAAGLAGYWNGIRADNGSAVNLKDLSGATTSVTFWQSGAAGAIAANDPSVTGDDALLMNDGIITYTFGVDSCFYFNNLQPGTYELTTYAWRPDYPTEQARTFVDNTFGTVITGGAWPGSQVEGVTYARHIVTVDASGFMGPHSGLAPGADQAVGAACNGMQLRRLGEFTSSCFGDGTGAACPCGNSGSAGHGCENSSTTGGALLAASGTPSLSADTMFMTSSGERPTAFSIFLQGSSTVSPVNYGDGLRCVAGTLKRLYLRNAVGGVVSAPQGTDLSVSARSAALGDPITAGQTRTYQTYYRDPTATFCPNPPGSTWNISNAVSTVWIP
jgi:hypothetical protein